MERTDFSARIAFVDYNGAQVYEKYLENKPKSASEREEFVKNNAPKIVSGIDMMERFLVDLKKNSMPSMRLSETPLVNQVKF